MNKFWRSSILFLLSSICYIPFSKSIEEKQTSIQNSNTKKFSLKSDDIKYDQTTNTIIAYGNNEVIFEDYNIKADYIFYDIDKDEVFADGNIIIINKDGKILSGSRALFTDSLKVGIIKEFILKSEESVVLAAVAKRVDENNIYLNRSVFTPCDISCGKTPIWNIQSEHTHIDSENHVIVHRNLFFKLYQIPIMYLPYFSHPTPNAPAKSGLLTPYIKQKSLVLPIYFRIKNNLDFTFSPRISNEATIYELEARHKIKYGEYKLAGSIAHVPYETKQNNSSGDKTKKFRYHSFSNGAFAYNQYNFGFDIKIASDKAYLKNYHQIFDSYLPSKIYLNKFHDNGYFLIDTMYFQGLRKEDELLKNPLVLPNIRNKLIYSISDDDSTKLTIDKRFNFYHEGDDTDVFRSAFDFSLNKYLISNNGHLINLGIHDKINFYHVHINNTINRLRINQYYLNKDSKASYFRHIPEISAKWNYPLIASISNRSILNIQPIVSLYLGQNFKEKYHKFGLIDSPKFDLDQENIFGRNRFSGMDYAEYGKRASYGIESNLLSEYLNINGFLGHSISRNNVQNKPEYTGSFGTELFEQYSLSYKFRKDKKLQDIRDEITLGHKNNNFNINLHFIQLNNISKYFAENNFNITKNRVRNLRISSGIKITENLNIGLHNTFDITQNNKYKKITRGITVTCSKDCVMINASISQDFTKDASRGLKANTSYNFILGLKVINM